MESKHTNKTQLVTGLKKMGLALLCMFIGPTLTYISPGMPNETKKYASLILGIVLCIAAVYFAFMGIKTILKSIFNDE